MGVRELSDQGVDCGGSGSTPNGPAVSAAEEAALREGVLMADAAALLADG